MIEALVEEFSDGPAVLQKGGKTIHFSIAIRFWKRNPSIWRIGA